MTDQNTETADHGLRELSMNEIDNVSGGFLPALILAFSVGFDIGFCATMALKPIHLN